MGSSRKGIEHKVFVKHFKLCPYCGETFKALGISNHRAACIKKKLKAIENEND